MNENHNPYQAPKSEISHNKSPSPSTTKLYTAGAVTLATLLGGPIGGGIVMAVNFYRLGQRSSGQIAVIVTTVYSIVFTVVVSIVPFASRMPSLLISAFQLLIIHSLSKLFFSEDIDLHMKRRGQMESTWKAAGIGAITFLVHLGVLFVLSVVFPSLNFF